MLSKGLIEAKAGETTGIDEDLRAIINGRLMEIPSKHTSMGSQNFLRSARAADPLPSNFERSSTLKHGSDLCQSLRRRVSDGPHHFNFWRTTFIRYEFASIKIASKNQPLNPKP